MDNNNLPEIKKEGMFSRIKNFFKSRFGIGKIVEEPAQEGEKETEKPINPLKTRIKVDPDRLFLEKLKDPRKRDLLISSLPNEKLYAILKLLYENSGNSSKKDRDNEKY